MIINFYSNDIIMIDFNVGVVCGCGHLYGGVAYVLEASFRKLAPMVHTPRLGTYSWLRAARCPPCVPALS